MVVELLRGINHQMAFYVVKIIMENAQKLLKIKLAESIKNMKGLKI